jgi:trimeric autotransporter adhesin
MSIGKHPTVLLRGLKAGLAGLALACGSSSDSAPSAPGPAPVSSVSVDPSSASLLVGATQTLTATPKDAAGNVLTGRTVAWSSSDQSIATVSSGGLVTAVAAGSTTITATSEGKFGSAANRGRGILITRLP